MPGRWISGGRASAMDRAMPVKIVDDPDRTRRFRDAALPYLDEVYTLARYLLRDPVDAEDAVQECFLRALKHFDGFRGEAIKPWLFAILRNVCRAEYARRADRAPAAAADLAAEDDALAQPWSEAPETPETQLLRRLDAAAVQRLLADLAEPFREVIVLREIQNLSYRDIAEVVDAPIGTVMSRLARGRSLLRAAWLAQEELPS